MHHLYPTAVKGDPLCPLGFHPQVRWPTRCKRCFRDYKEHGGRHKDDSSLRRDEITVSSPSLSSWSSSTRSHNDSLSSSSSSTDSGVSSRSAGSSSSRINDLSSTKYDSSESLPANSRFGSKRPAVSWTSTPDLGNLSEDTHAEEVTVNLKLPRRVRPAQSSAVTEASSDSYTFRRRTTDLSSISTDKDSSSFNHASSGSVSSSESKKEKKTDSLSQKQQRKSPRSSNKSKDSDDTDKRRRLQIQSLKEVRSFDEPTNPEVEFIIQVKSSKGNKSGNKIPKKVSENIPSTAASNQRLSVPVVTGSGSSSSGSSGASSGESYEDESDDDISSVAGTETTETTLVDRNESELHEQIESLKQELDSMRSRCERLEREKSDILLSRIASMQTAPSKTAASEVLKLQQKVNELQAHLEDVSDDKKSLLLRVKELEEEVELRPDVIATKRTVDELQSKLLAAETLCEELMDENEDMKKELRDLEEEIEEMQDNFREEQADEYTSLKKELEQTAKNCRVLSFKLRKAERKSEQLEAEKLEIEKKYREMAGGQTGLEKSEKIKQLEQELNVANEVAVRLQKELEDVKSALKSKEETVVDKDSVKTSKKKAPMLGSLGKSSSGEKVSRESMTRGGSQEDPAQLLRDLQDSLEREADLREQLRYAEEEAEILRKKATRVEDDNESLVLQLKKMATKARSHRQSPSPARMTPEPYLDKDEGISDDDDPAELRILLELNEQESAVLRRKVEDLENEAETSKMKIKELQEKLTSKFSRSDKIFGSTFQSGKVDPLQENKMKVLEDELAEIRKKLIEKDRDCERLHAELAVAQKRVSKSSLQKSKSLDSGNEQQNLDLKRQLQVIEQEATILRSKIQTLESENDKLNMENKRLQILRGSKKVAQDINSSENSSELKEKISRLETQLEEANNQVTSLRKELDAKEEELKVLTETDTKSKGTSKDADSGKIKKELKLKVDELEKSKAQMNKIEAENKNLTLALKRLKEDSIETAAKFYKQRVPKKPSDFTTKLQMKKMVEELESEIGEILTVLAKSENEKNKLKKDTKPTQDNDTVNKESKLLKTKLDDANQKAEKLEKELKHETENLEKLRKENNQEKKKFETAIKKLEDEKLDLEEQLKKMKHDIEVSAEENKNLSGKVKQLQAEKDAAEAKQENISVFIQRIESLKTELEKEQKHNVTLKQQLEDSTIIKQENNKLKTDIIEKGKQISEAEEKVKALEEKIKKSTTSHKSKLSKLEKELEEERGKAQLSDTNYQNIVKECTSLKNKISEYEKKVSELESTIESKTAIVKQLEKSLKEEQERTTTASKKVKTAEKEEIAALKKELLANKTHEQDLQSKLDKLETLSKIAEERHNITESELKKEKQNFESKVIELETTLQVEKKKTERMKTSHEKESKNKDQELSSLRNKIRSLENNTGLSSKKLQEEYENKVKNLEEQLRSEHQEYEDLTTKYEILEREHVVTKAQLVMEREAIERQHECTKQELAAIESELKTLRETYNNKQDTWIKEKLDLQEKLKETEEKMARSNGSDNWSAERARLRANIEERNVELERYKKEIDVLNDQIDNWRKENEELRHKLEDFDKVVKIHRNMSADTSAIDRELKETRSKMIQQEKDQKAEIVRLKMRYDSRVAMIGEEIQALQAQATRFKRERDTFRHMLEGAQKAIADLKAAPDRGQGDHATSHVADEFQLEETQTKIASLEQQISCMEDELSEARLECSKLKTELISERSAWEVKLAEMQSRINELEEDRLISSGRAKIPGMRTRIELAWHKEREEQQRLLQETSTLARDLRQTLFEVERERDKERLEAKRRLDQLKKTTEEEQEENKKKVTELQCDLLELRDAHAKLRTTNEKLRREKERYEHEREELRQYVSSRRRAEQDEERKMAQLISEVDELMRLAPEIFSPEKNVGASVSTPTPPRRLKGPKSRESSPALERKEFKRETSVDRMQQLQSTVQKLIHATEELKSYQRLSEEEKEKDRAKRHLGFRRAASTESETTVPDSALQKGAKSNTTGLKKKGSLYRKSLSLEQTSGSHQDQQNIWKGDEDTDGSFTSLHSVGSVTDQRFYSLQRRDASVDSRLSGGSTQSEVQSGEKKKKGILGKLKKLTKSHSTEETNSFPDSKMYTDSNSDFSTGQEEKGSKKDLREKITGIFKKSGSRSNSVERNAKSSKESSPAIPDRTVSTQRPLIKSGSGSTGTLPRASPARVDISQTSSISRPLAPKVKKTTSSTSSSEAASSKKKTK